MRRKKTKKGGGGINPRVTRNITEEEVLRRIAGKLCSNTGVGNVSLKGSRKQGQNRLLQRGVTISDGMETANS